MPKNPMLVDQVIFKPDNTVDPSETGGLTYKSGTGFRMNVAGSIYFETDAAKLWVYDGVGWKGVTVA